MLKRLLLVEDHADTRVVLAMILKREGYEVVAVETSADALAACSSQHFDLLIGDLQLPDGSGLDLMREVAQKCHIKGVAYTGHGSESDIINARAAGFSAHLVKPVPNELLFQTIARLISESGGDS